MIGALFFSGLFGALEETVAGQSKSEALGISTYGISMTTLEEVFLKLGEHSDKCENSLLKYTFFTLIHIILMLGL